MSDAPGDLAQPISHPFRMRILFVDDEEMVLRMLRMAVASMRSEEWEACFVSSGSEALELLARQTFDMVVSDMRMPGMNGAQLLNEVFKLHPATFRVILTGFVEQERVMETLGTAHQFLSKPFQLDALKEVLRRAAMLKQRLRGSEARRLVSQTGCVPSVPDVYFKILEALQEPDCPIERIAELAITDPGLTSKLLQLVNSAFFGFSSPVSNAKEAVMLLGTSTVRSLALTCRLFSAFRIEASNEFSLEQVWGHSWRVARAGEQIARLERSDLVVTDQAFTAGLLHDLGKLVLAHGTRSHYPALVRRACQQNRPLSALESETYGASHAEVGACLLQLWGLPSALVEAVLWHEHPGAHPAVGFSPAVAVHVANALDHEFHRQVKGPVPPPLDLTCLERLQLASRLPAWREAVAAGR